MSEANVKYVIEHNSEIPHERVEVCPNSIDVVDKSVDEGTKSEIRSKYNIPLEKKVFVYGGNLGKPQGIPFLIECLNRGRGIDEAFFLIVGDGTEYGLLEEYANTSEQKNLKLMRHLPKEDYDTLVGACDVGMIFLDHRFTIPNFPSRLLGYMQAKLPVLAVTDTSTDIGKVIEEGNFGWWCESNSTYEFCRLVKTAIETSTEQLGECAYEALKELYSVEDSYETIISSI